MFGFWIRKSCSFDIHASLIILILLSLSFVLEYVGIFVAEKQTSYYRFILLKLQQISEFSTKDTF